MIPSGVLETIPDIAEAIRSGLPILRRQVASSVGRSPRLPLIPGTEPFAGHWLPKWYERPFGWINHDVAVHSLMDARISGSGQIWLGNGLITAPEIMPKYVFNDLDIPGGGNARLHRHTSLPIRRISTPCLVATGHGTGVYGHFLVEMLFRILITRAAFRGTALAYKILLDRTAPAWLLTILTEHLGIGETDIVFFDPASEQVLLRHALVPTLILQWGGIHPFANELLAGLLATLRLPDMPETPKRVFVARKGFRNPQSANRVCLNEERLIAIAQARHGFVPVAMETLPWPEQIAIARNAALITGLAGSALHNTLFSAPGSCLASIGVMNFTQSEIGHLRRQHLAFFDGKFPAHGVFAVDEGMFEAYLDAVVQGGQALQPPDALSAPHPLQVPAPFR